MSSKGFQGDNDVNHARRKLLLRLGLAVPALYVAPALLQLGRAKASSFSVSLRPQRRSSPRPASPTRPPEIVVATPDAGDIDLISALGYGLIARDRLEIAGTELVRFSLPANVSVEQARQQIAEQAPTALFDINHIYRPQEFTCGGGTCAAFEAIGWRGASHQCPSGVVIGMIDTRVNIEHAALQDVDIETFPAIANDREPASAVHGTAVAILMAGRRDSRTPGLLQGASIVAAESFHRDRAGMDAADAYDVARGIDTLAHRGIGVINLSLAGPHNTIVKHVVDAVLRRDVILVAAAGNAGPQADPLFPAAYEGVVAVTAIDHRNRVYRQAIAGDHIDFAAPGVRLWTAASLSGGRFRSGTSYATPFVAVALAVARARWPEAKSDSLIGGLAEGVVDLGPAGRDTTFGWGLVQMDGECPSGRGPQSAGG